MRILGDIGAPGTASFKFYVAALRSESIVRRIRVDLLDRNEKAVGELTLMDQVYVMDGAVQVDSTAAVTRSLNMLLLDPYGVVFFDPNVASRKSLFMDRFIRVSHELWVPALNKWVVSPIFTGVIVKLEQDGVYITVEAMGKESLLMTPALYWRTRTFKKNTKITYIIRTLLRDKGETKIDLPEIPKRIKKPLTVLPRNEPWRVINRLAKSANMHCFYDGNGTFRMRRRPTNSISTFEHGVDIMTNPSKPYDFLGVANVVQVRGPKPKQKNHKQIIETERLHQNHPMSAQSLARNGKGRYLVMVVENTHLRKRARGKEQARRILRNSTDFLIDATFDSLIIPFFDENDIVTARAPIGTVRFIMKKWSIPFGVGGSMSIGFNKRPKMMKRRFRLKVVA